MITQTLKRWLNKLFAWWPWGQSTDRHYTRAVNNMNRGTTQELVWRTSVDEYVPQPGITSVVVEHGMDEPSPEGRQAPVDELSERVSPSSLSPNKNVTEPPSPSNEAVADASEEQHLSFLYYLVKRGVYNEGFTPGQEPEQYKNNFNR